MLSIQCGDRVVSELNLAEKVALQHGQNCAVFEPATQTSQEQEREQEREIQLPNTSSKELAAPVPKRLRKLLHSTNTAPEISHSIPHREDSQSNSGPLLRVLVARRHIFSDRRRKLQPETAMPVTWQAPAGTSITRSPAATYKNTSKIAQREASVPIEPLKERKQRAAPQNDHRESAVSDNTGGTQPATLAQERTTSGPAGTCLPLQLSPLWAEHTPVWVVSAVQRPFTLQLSVVSRPSAPNKQPRVPRTAPNHFPLGPLFVCPRRQHRQLITLTACGQARSRVSLWI